MAVAVDTQTFCEIGGMAAFCCDHCRGLRHIEVQPLDDDTAGEERRPRCGREFGAYWQGKCSGCKEKFQPGDLIQADGYGDYVIVACCGGGTSG